MQAYHVTLYHVNKQIYTNRQLRVGHCTATIHHESITTTKVYVNIQKKQIVWGLLTIERAKHSSQPNGTVSMEPTRYTQVPAYPPSPSYLNRLYHERVEAVAVSLSQFSEPIQRTMAVYTPYFPNRPCQRLLELRL